MICPKCKELNQKSIVHCGLSYSTAMHCQPYFDEDGKFHRHDYNSQSTEYSCSKGHTIYVSPSNRCPNCDFGHDGVITATDTPPMTGTVVYRGNVNIKDGSENIVTFSDNVVAYEEN